MIRGVGDVSPPEFWRRAPASPCARLLSPLSALYGAVAAARMARLGAVAALPTIVVGGFTVGGDGKTPTALAVAALLERLGEQPAFLSRGFGRRRGARPEPFVVDPARDGAQEAGDEPLLLARAAPTIVGVDRAAAARLAQDVGASVLVLDDGLQSRRLEPDFAIAAIDADYGVGNGLCLPAGPLRAPLSRQIESVDAVLSIGAGGAGEAVLRAAGAAGKQIFRSRMELDARTTALLSGERVLAFAGVARPEKFLAALNAAGAVAVGFRRFADHRPYSRGEIDALRREADRLRAILVTTEKDLARLGEEASIAAASARLVFEDEEAVRVALEAALERARLSRGV